MRTKYPSDISMEQFEKIQPILELARKKTKPRQLSLYDVFCAVVYIITTGCQWRELPHDFPKWYSVYFYFQIWKEKPKDKDSILEEVLKKINPRLSRRTRSKSPAQHAYC